MGSDKFNTNDWATSERDRATRSEREGLRWKWKWWKMRGVTRKRELGPLNNPMCHG